MEVCVPREGGSRLAWAQEAPPTTRAPLPAEADLPLELRKSQVGGGQLCQELEPALTQSCCSKPRKSQPNVLEPCTLAPHPTPTPTLTSISFLIWHSPSSPGLSPTSPPSPRLAATPGVPERPSRALYQQGHLPRTPLPPFHTLTCVPRAIEAMGRSTDLKPITQVCCSLPV